MIEHARSSAAEQGVANVDFEVADITTLDEDSLARLRGEKIGFVFQFFHLVPSLTAFENILVPMEIARRRDAAERTRRRRWRSR